MTQYQPDSVNAWFIHSEEEWSVLRINGAWTLCYTQLDLRNMKPKTKALGVAFANTGVMRLVASHLISMADVQDILDRNRKEALK